MKLPKTSTFPTQYSMREYVTEHTIVICEKCTGLGQIGEEILEDYHKREYSTEYKVCPNCKGTGRLVKTHKWQISYDPFDPKKWLNTNIRFKLDTNEEAKSKSR